MLSRVGIIVVCLLCVRYYVMMLFSVRNMCMYLV